MVAKSQKHSHEDIDSTIATQNITQYMLSINLHRGQNAHHLKSSTDNSTQDIAVVQSLTVIR